MIVTLPGRPWRMRMLLLLVTAFSLAVADHSSAEVRALWVTRWDYKAEEDVVSIMANLPSHGFNTVLFQIRGSGTVLYPSEVEEWAWELTGDSPETTGKDPGWDPLSVAIREAHRHGLQIYAYLNVLPGWRGTEPAPKRSGQLWSTHPDWFMVDALGKRMQPYKTWYTFLSPHHPEVRSYLKRLFAEVAGNYDIDGIHLDYFRFPADYQAARVYPKASQTELRQHKDFSYDKTALRLFRELSGGTPLQSPEAWDQFRRDALTDLLQDIRSAALEKRPGLVISSAVIADPAKGRNVYFQDSAHWFSEGLLDLAFPMNYEAKAFDKNLSAYCTAVGEKYAGRVAVGISLAHPAKEIRRQIALARSHRLAGVALFAYSSIFKNHKPTENAKAVREIFSARP